MKTRCLEVSLALGLTLLLGACSSSKPKEGEMTDIIPASTEAGTDIVPAATAEGAPAATPDAQPAPPSAETSGDATKDQATASQATSEGSAPTDAAPLPGKKKKKKSKPSMTQGEVVAAPPVDLGPMSAGEYSVQRGDTLMKIAFETYGDLYKWKAIYDANRDKIQDPSRIPAGTVLKLEKPNNPLAIERNGEKYQIQTGDTLSKISKNVYGTPGKWKTLWNNNKQLIHDPNKIFAGFSLYYVPDASAPHPMASGGSPQGIGNVPQQLGMQGATPQGGGQAPNAFANSNSPGMNNGLGGTPSGGPAPASIPDAPPAAVPSN